ncbi:glycosyltransferase family 2 protein [Allocoleopsis franciscana]|uniref:Glycosyl transferase n=1 Tax=Allocoleopsis franciscana PCC 7113 TaxID=1173027 RepID=K9WLT2_9CYAN|nr:glycosyltransferase family 2 protein [Allocoleopsis franciscana]AFZ21370.1 glycosyl transferase [Allocoleopsis franciscana PCC 7113]
MVKDLPKISIVTPSFNQVEFIEATIQSILNQGYPNLEYIIIDGGSTDGSVEIIKKYEKYLHFWCSEPDAGQYDAINKGFAHSTGEIMAWLNSDDMYCSWALKTVASIMSELSEVDWLTTLAPAYWDWYGFCYGITSITGYSRKAYLDGFYLPGEHKTCLGWIQQESTFWRRNLWQRVGGFIASEFSLAGDFDLWSRFYSHADLYGTPSPLGGFRYQPNQRSRQLEKYLVEAQKSLTQMRTLFNWSPNYSRSIALQLRLNKIPKVRTLSQPMYSYVGKRIVRKNLDSPDSYWKVEEYKFS